MPRKPPTPRFIIPDTELPHDGRKLTVGQRFANERRKFEVREGITLLKALEGTGLMGPQRLRAIEQTGAPIPDKLWRHLIGMRLDLHYIMHGERTLTDAEQHVRDFMRLVSKEDRALILSMVGSMTINIKEIHNAYGEIVYLADEEGNPLGPHAVAMVEP